MGRGWLRKPDVWGTEPVPVEKRNLRAVDLGILWFSLGLGLLVLFTGALLVQIWGLSLFEVLVVAVAGSVIGSLMLAAAGTTGSRHGVPTMVSLRPILGHRASWIPSGFNSLQLLGWASFEFMIMGLGLSLISGPFLGSATVYLWIAILGVWVTLLALGGPLVVVRVWLEKAAVWLVLVSAAWLTYVVVTHAAFAPNFLVPSGSGDRPLGLALDLVIVMPISWWPLIADYNRFARGPGESFVGTFLGYTLSNSWFYFLGAGLLVVYGLVGTGPGSDPVSFITAIVGTGLGSLVLLLIIVDETDNAFANVYSTAVSAQNIAPRAGQRSLILATALASIIAGSVLAAFLDVFLSVYEGFLFLIGGVFVPLLGVIVADRFVRPAYRDEEFGTEGARANPVALGAWAVGAAVYFAIAGVGLGATVALVPSFLPSPVGASLPAFVAAALAHAAGTKLAAPFARRASA